MSFSTIKIKFTQDLSIGDQVAFNIYTNYTFSVPISVEFIENFVTNRTTINQVTTPSVLTAPPGVQTAIQYFNSIQIDLTNYGFTITREINEITIDVENVDGYTEFSIGGIFAGYTNPASVEFTINNQYTPTINPTTPTTGGGNQIKLYWNGAIDDNGISGYQLQWRTSTTVPWSQVISIPHDSNYSTNTSQTGGGSYSHSATQLVDHFFRIRIVDNSGQYSEYKYITASVDTNVILISKIGSNFSTFVCTANPLTPEDPVLLSPLPQNIIVTNVTYVKNTDNTTFNGSGKYWRILLSGAQYACKVELDGLITEVIDCELEGLGTVYHTENISSTGVTSVTTSGSVCDLVLSNSIYFTGVLGVGTILYRVVDDGGNLSDPLPGANKFYVVGSSIVKISSSPAGKVLSIQDYSTSCPDVSVCCFVKGTKISMSDNTSKNIEDVIIGDIVITYNEETKLQEPGEVNGIASPIKSNIVEYKLSNDVIIKSTTCHPYWVINKGWSSFNPLLTKRLYNFSVEQIEEKDILLTIDNKEVIVDKITELINKKFMTYNLQITGNHTYYANGILVHNKTVPTAEPNRYDQFGQETAAWTTWNNTYGSGADPTQISCVAAANPGGN